MLQTFILSCTIGDLCDLPNNRIKRELDTIQSKSCRVAALSTKIAQDAMHGMQTCKMHHRLNFTGEGIFKVEVHF